MNYHALHGAEVDVIPEITIGVPYTDLPSRYDAVRRGGNGFLDRVQSRLAKHLSALHTGGMVRGDGVAAELLVNGLLRQKWPYRCELFTHPDLIPVLGSHLSRLGIGRDGDHGGLRVGVNSVLDLTTGVDKYGINAWFDPSAALTHSLRARRNFSHHVYPVTSVIHGFSTHTLLRSFFLEAVLLGMYPCDSIICSTTACRDGVRKIIERVTAAFNEEHGTHLCYDGRLDLIPLCVDTEKLSPADKVKARASLGLDKESIILLYLGRLAWIKADLLPLIYVFASLVKSCPRRRLALVVAGTESGNFTAPIRNYAASLGVARYVHFILDPPDETKVRLLQAADVYVSPVDCMQESFGLAPVEAMACGVPQVVPDWDGFRDTVVHNETGFLVPTYWAKCDDDLDYTGPLLGWAFDHISVSQSVAIDLSCFKSALDSLVQNDELRHRMSEASRKRALAVYGFDSVMRQYRDLWSELVGIARGLGTSLAPDKVERACYWETFQHYPSHHLDDTTKLRLSRAGEDIVRGRVKLPLDSSTLAVRVLNADLLENALSALASTGDDAGLSSIGAMSDALVEKTGYHRDYVCRHVLWLLKQGFTTLVDPPAQPVRASAQNGRIQSTSLALPALSTAGKAPA